MAQRKHKAADPPPAFQACVIGAGLGGLALAIRLQAAGVRTVVVEAREQAGGLIRTWQRDGCTFSDGPAAIADPAPLRELWSLTGDDIANDLPLIEVAPGWRCNWPDGAVLDLPANPAQLARIAPDDLAGYEAFIAWCEASRSDAWQRLAEQAQERPLAILEAAPALLRHQGWRSVRSLVASLVKSERLREALSFPVLGAGANPAEVSAVTLPGQIPPRWGPAWWPQGGMGRMIAVLAARFEQLGGTLRLHDPVVRVHTIGNRASEVECASGWRAPIALIASNADVVHTYRDLLGQTQRGGVMARKLANKRFSPSAFTVHFALEGTWPGIPHRTVLFGPRFAGLLDDIFTIGVLPQDQMILLAHPSLTDPGLAPPGKSIFSATVPVANLARLPIDWDTVGPVLARRVLKEIGRRLVPDIADRIVTAFHTTPRDLALDFNAWAGAGWSLAAIPAQSGPLRPHHRDRKLANVFLVGAGTHPGAGLAAVLAGAKATAAIMVESRS
ncbi:MAG: phytoene desaturase [Sphingomonadales bacterium]|nr:phytoene desaturase [Sphingomonadales bacterium]